MSTALHLAPLVTQGLINGPIDVYEKSMVGGRDIGVGIWSTALDPFQQSSRDSLQLVYDNMTKHGTFVRDVGYRCPKGQWLAESRLDDDLPGLLFLREVDMLSALRKAVHLEEQRGTVHLHVGLNYKIDSIYEQSADPWAAPLMIQNIKTGQQEPTARSYHLIAAADGMNSVIRKTYGGHLSKRHLTGTTALPGPLDLEHVNTHSAMRAAWDEMGQAEATSTLDREYTVFRGNARLTTQDTGTSKSFQTWGEGRSMRFATVPMLYLNDHTGKREERQVWFITINDDTITSETDPAKRRDLLVEAFRDWHDPVCKLVEATPPDEILMERAMAHKHCMGPVIDFNQVVKQIRGAAPPSAGGGPAIQFMGDAFMCIDPILAQGFTIGMEGAARLAQCLESCLQAPNPPEYPNLGFDPFLLRDELKLRHERRLGRLIHLLRATELVQALGQPTSGTLSGMVSRDILRPLMRITPGFIKTPIFNAMLKYSLAVPQRRKK